MSQSINVNNTPIRIIEVNNQDFICLTDIAKGQEGEDHIRNWMRNRNTIEYIGIWETLNNPNFKGVEFDTFRSQAGLNSFNMTPQKWIQSTDAIGVISKSGRGGGTYAHRDIAFHFSMWLSPIFQLYIVKEYQKLKEAEANEYNLEWNVKRILSKANYRLQTDAIKNHIIPQEKFSKTKEWILYADEADLLNIAMWGCTAKEWKEANPERALKGENIRDMASINELAVLANIENLNSVLIGQGTPKEERLKFLISTAKQQIESLNGIDVIKSIKKLDQNTFVSARNTIEKKVLSKDKKSKPE